MRALVFEGAGRVEHAVVPDPWPVGSEDAVVTVERAGLCGSDLHPYEGREPARAGVVAGHEAVGTVSRVGGSVVGFRPGDRVIVPFSTSCGVCRPCRRGVTARCVRGRLFGWGDPIGRPERVLHGGQAERLLVPLAGSTLVGWPEGLSADGAVLMADNLPTALEALQRAGPSAETRVAVVGCGAVGLSVVAAAVDAGAEVVAVDPVEARRARALALGASDVRSPDAVDGAGTFPAVVEAAGSGSAQRMAFRLLEPGGGMSVIAVQTADAFAFDPAEAYGRNLRVAFGRASVRATLGRELADPERRRRLVGLAERLAGMLVTHPGLPLDAGPDVYRTFASRSGGMVKATFDPAASARSIG